MNQHKDKSPNIYCSKFHIKCYNFYQQYEKNFATIEVTRLNEILFMATFLQDQINLR